MLVDLKRKNALYIICNCKNGLEWCLSDEAQNNGNKELSRNNSIYEFSGIYPFEIIESHFKHRCRSNDILNFLMLTLNQPLSLILSSIKLSQALLLKNTFKSTHYTFTSAQSSTLFYLPELFEELERSKHRLENKPYKEMRMGFEYLRVHNPEKSKVNVKKYFSRCREVSSHKAKSELISADGYLLNIYDYDSAVSFLKKNTSSIYLSTAIMENAYNYDDDEYSSDSDFEDTPEIPEQFKEKNGAYGLNKLLDYILKPYEHCIKDRSKFIHFLNETSFHHEGASDPTLYVISIPKYLCNNQMNPFYASHERGEHCTCHSHNQITAFNRDVLERLQNEDIDGILRKDKDGEFLPVACEIRTAYDDWDDEETHDLGIPQYRILASHLDPNEAIIIKRFHSTTLFTNPNPIGEKIRSFLH